MRQEEILLDLVRQGYEPEGEIKDFPLEIVSQMLYEQVKQGNKLDVDVFERGKNRGIPNGGFAHRQSDQGEAFWTEVLGEDNLETAFRKYYEFNERNIELYCYALDLLVLQNPSLEFKGEISGFPVEVVAMMIAESINQTGYSNYENFERNPDVGFTWRFSPEGKAFWSKLINYKDFKPFFTEYPDLENECKQIRNLNAIKSGKIKKDISVKDFMKDNKSNLQALERRSKEVFDLTVELLTQLQILEDRKKQAKVEPKAKPKAKSKAKPKAKKEEPKNTTTTPKPKKEKSKPKEVVIEDIDFDDDDLDFAKGGVVKDLNKHFEPYEDYYYSYYVQENKDGTYKLTVSYGDKRGYPRDAEIKAMRKNPPLLPSGFEYSNSSAENYDGSPMTMLSIKESDMYYDDRDYQENEFDGQAYWTIKKKAKSKSKKKEAEYKPKPKAKSKGKKGKTYKFETPMPFSMAKEDLIEGGYDDANIKQIKGSDAFTISEITIKDAPLIGTLAGVEELLQEVIMYKKEKGNWVMVDYLGNKIEQEISLDDLDF